MKKLLLITSMITATASPAFASSCGDVTIADMNWASASLFANVDKFILENGYGCNVELVTGDTNATGASMTEKGTPDIAPELWTNSLLEALNKGVAEKRLRLAGTPLPDGGEEAFWVPKYMVDKDPSLATIDGIMKNAKLFPHNEDESKSGLYGCPAGWACQTSTENLYKALNMESAGFEVIDPGSGPALAGSIAKAYERKQGWLGYYWSPTSVLGKYEMVKVDFGSGIDQKHYEECITNKDCEDPKPTMFPPSSIHTVTTEAFAVKAGGAYEYLSKRGLSNQDTSKILAWKEDNQADGETVADYFLNNNKDVWKSWVSEDVAAKVEAALN